MVELYLDTTPRIRMSRDSVPMFTYYGLVSRSTVRFRFAMGDTSLWSRAAMTYYDAALDGWEPMVADTQFYRTWFGIYFEYVRLPPMRRAVECFVPWSFLGSGVWTTGTALANRRLSFACGYGDVDGPADSGAIFWLKGSPVDDTLINYWGELVLASDMPPVDETAVTPVPPPAHARVGTPSLATEYYTLAGSRLSAARTAGVLVVRHAGAGQATGARLKVVASDLAGGPPFRQ